MNLSLRFPARYQWAALITRLFEILPLTCRHYGAEMTVIAFVTEAPLVRAILAHIGEPTPALARSLFPVYRPDITCCDSV